MPEKIVSQNKLANHPSDFFVKLFRSWKFVILQLAFIAIWIVLNTIHLVSFDPWPFNGLKLALLIEVLFMGSMILMNQSRQSGLDRKIIFQDYIAELSIKKEIEKIRETLDALKNHIDKNE
jgi:uncharacterized membrane protein